MTGLKAARHHKHTAMTVFAVLFAFLSVASVSAEQITVEYIFDSPQVETVVIDGQTFDRVTMNNAPNDGDVGYPSLPARGGEILLPPGTEVDRIEVVTGERILVGSGYNVEPVAQPFKLSEGPGVDNAPRPNQGIYSSTLPTPETRVESVCDQGFRGYRLQILKLNPVEYIPATGDLYYHPSLKVTVHTVDSDRPVSSFRGLAADARLVADRVDNVETARAYPMPALATASNYDFLIITTSSLAASFQPLKDYHDSTGMPTEIHTTSEIGSTNPDDVRDYIRERYLTDGISYVMIGGDDNIIPAKNLYVSSGNSGEVEYNMPGDVYFACLDGTWNYDGDSQWGEIFDGEGGQALDLVAEVYIGRASVGSSTEANRFVEKTLKYLTVDDPYLFEVLMLGEHLGFGGVSDYAAAMMEQNVDTSEADNRITTGIPSSTYDIDRLYDRDYSGNYWPTWELTTRINNGLHIINHLGHGSPSSAMKLSNSSVVSQLHNEDLFFVYSQTCLAGRFDDYDCFAEYMNIKTDHGAFAVVMNARFGWGTSNTTDGPSQRFNRQFWDAVYNVDENKPELGRANQDAKEDNLSRINSSCMRWVYYESNLFGDPTVAIKRPLRKGLAFVHPTGIPAYILPEQEYVVSTDLSAINNGTPVPGSVKLNYSIDSSSYSAIAMSEVSGGRYEATLPPQVCGANLEFYYSATEGDGGEFYDPAPDAPYNPEVASVAMIQFEDHFELDAGWTVTGDATAGTWERGYPAGDGSTGDPLNDFDGSGQCFVTGNAIGADVVGGSTYLMSPTFSLADGDGKVRYARWFCNDAGTNPHSVAFMIHISNDDGANWVRADVAGPFDQSSGGWFENSFWASEFVTPTDQMKLRFQAYDYTGSCVEAAVDDVSVTRYSCDSWICGDLNADSKVTLSDITLLIDHVYISKSPLDFPEAANTNGSVDMKLTLADITTLIDHVYISKAVMSCL